MAKIHSLASQSSACSLSGPRSTRSPTLNKRSTAGSKPASSSTLCSRLKCPWISPTAKSRPSGLASKCSNLLMSQPLGSVDEGRSTTTAFPESAHVQHTRDDWGSLIDWFFGGRVQWPLWDSVRTPSLTCHLIESACPHYLGRMGYPKERS